MLALHERGCSAWTLKARSSLLDARTKMKWSVVHRRSKHLEKKIKNSRTFGRFRLDEHPGRCAILLCRNHAVRHYSRFRSCNVTRMAEEARWKLRCSTSQLRDRKRNRNMGVRLNSYCLTHVNCPKLAVVLNFPLAEEAQTAYFDGNEHPAIISLQQIKRF